MKGKKQSFLFLMLIMLMMGCEGKIKDPIDEKIISSSVPDYETKGLSFHISYEKKEGVSVKSDFIFETRSLKMRAFDQVVQISPQVDCYITPLKPGKWHIRPKKPLPYNTLFQVRYEDEEKKHSFAFQTEDTLRVLKTLPRNKEAGVSLQAPIRIDFNQKIQPKDIQRIQVSPLCSGDFSVEDQSIFFHPTLLSSDTVYTVSVSLAEGDYRFRFQTGGNATVGDIDMLSSEYILYGENPAFTVYFPKSANQVQVSLARYEHLLDYEEERGVLEENKTWMRWPHRFRGEKNSAKTLKSQVYPLEKGSANFRYTLSKEVPYGYYVAFFKVGEDTYYVFFEYRPFDCALLSGEDAAYLILSGPKANYRLKIGDQEMPGKKTGDFWQFSLTNPKAKLTLEDDEGLFYDFRLGEQEGLMEKELSFFVDKNITTAGSYVHFYGKWQEEDLKVSLRPKDGPGFTLRTQKVNDIQNQCYAGMFSLGDLPVGEYWLVASGKSGQRKCPLYVSDYEKPQRTLQIETDKDVYVSGEEMSVTAEIYAYEEPYQKGGALHYEISFGEKNEKGMILLENNHRVQFSLPLTTEAPNLRPVEMLLRLRFEPKGRNDEIKAEKSLLLFPKPFLLEEKYWEKGRQIGLDVKGFAISGRDKVKYEKPFALDRLRGEELNLKAVYTLLAYENESMSGMPIFSESRTIHHTQKEAGVQFERDTRLNYKVSLQVFKENVCIYEGQNVIYSGERALPEAEAKDALTLELDATTQAYEVSLDRVGIQTPQNLSLYRLEEGRLLYEKIKEGRFLKESINNANHYWVVGKQGPRILKSEKYQKNYPLSQVQIRVDTEQIGGQSYGEIHLSFEEEAFRYGVFYIMPDALFQKSSWYYGAKQFFEADKRVQWTGQELEGLSFEARVVDKKQHKFRIPLPKEGGAYRLFYGIASKDKGFSIDYIPFQVDRKDKLLYLQKEYVVGEQPLWRYFDTTGSKSVSLSLYQEGRCVYKEQKSKGQILTFLPPPFESPGRYTLGVWQISEQKRDYEEYEITVSERRNPHEHMVMYALSERGKKDISAKGQYRLMNRDAFFVSDQLHQLMQLGNYDFPSAYAKEMAKWIGFQHKLAAGYDGGAWSRFQNQDGGISNLPKGKSDVALTAQSYYLGAKGLEKTLMEAFLSRQIGTDEVSESLAIWALGAEGKPLLNLLRERANGRKDDRAKMYTVMAFFEMGDLDSAKLYHELWFAHRWKEVGIYSYLEGKEGPLEMPQQMLAALMHATLGDLNWQKNFEYLRDKSQKPMGLYMERILLMKQIISNFAMEGTLAYEQNHTWLREAYRGLAYREISGEDLKKRALSGVENMAYVSFEPTQEGILGVRLECKLEKGHKTIQKGAQTELLVEIEWSKEALPGQYVLGIYLPEEVVFEEGGAWPQKNQAFLGIDHSILDRKNSYRFKIKPGGMGKIHLAEVVLERAFPHEGWTSQRVFAQIED